MAFSSNGNGLMSNRRTRGITTLSEMNVVPLVDVVLVLLIIFMMTAHVMEFGLEVEVPRVKQVKDSAEELPVITITKGGELYLNEKQVNFNRLGEEIRAKFPTQKAVYVRADRGAIWDPIAQVISALGEAKLEPRMVTQPVDHAGK